MAVNVNGRYGDDPKIDAIWSKILEWKNVALAGGDQTPPHELFEALDRATKGKT